MGKIKSFFKHKRDQRISKLNNDAYDEVKKQIRYATMDQVTVRLHGDPDTFKALFETLSDEGYVFTYEYIEGDLSNMSGLTFLTVKCKRVLDVRDLYPVEETNIIPDENEEEKEVGDT